MPNYQETQVDGTKWRRCEQIEIHNPSAPEVPKIVFKERDVVAIDGKTVSVEGFVPPITVDFDPTAVIDIYDPVTLEPTGATMTHAEAYAVLFSAYMTSALARDEALANMAPPTPEPEPEPQ